MLSSRLQDDQGVASVLISSGSENLFLRQLSGQFYLVGSLLYDLDIISTTAFLARISYGWRGWIISIVPWRQGFITAVALQ